MVLPQQWPVCLRISAHTTELRQTLNSPVWQFHVADGWMTIGLGMAGGGIGSWRGLAAALGERLFMGLDSAQLYADALLGELGTEVMLWRLGFRA